MADINFFVSGNCPSCKKFIGFEASIDHECYDESPKEPPTESFRIDRVVQLLNSHFSKVEEGFSRMDARFNLLEERVKIIDSQSTRTDEQLYKMRKTLTTIDRKVDKHVDAIQNNVQSVKHEMKARFYVMEKRPLKELGMIQKQFTTIDAHFIRLNERFDAIQENVEAFKVGTGARFDVMEEHAKAIKESLNFDDDDFTIDAQLNKRFDTIQESVESFKVGMDARFDVMEEHAKAIKEVLNFDDDDSTIDAHLNKRFDAIQESVEAFKVGTNARFDVMEKHVKAIQKSLDYDDDYDDNNFTTIDIDLNKRIDAIQENVKAFKVGMDARFDVMEEHAKAIQESLDDDDDDDTFASEDHTKLDKMCEKLENIFMLEKFGVVHKKVDSVVANLNVMLSRIELVDEKLNLCCKAKDGDDCCSLRRDRHTDDGFLAELDTKDWWKELAMVKIGGPLDVMQENGECTNLAGLTETGEGLDVVPEDIRDIDGGIAQPDIGSDELLEGTQSQDAPWVVI